MLVISPNLVLSAAQEFPPWSPIVGWHNLVTSTNVDAGNEDPLNPASNLATHLTAELWKAADTSEQRIVVTPEYMGDIDYIAVARHNFGSARIAVSVEVYTETDEGGPNWVEVVPDVLLGNNAPVIFRFELQPVVGVCLRLRTGIAPGSAAVLYVGKLLVLPDHIQTDFTPLPYGRVLETANDLTESGEYLGPIVLGKKLESSVSLPYLDPDWYREEMDPFIRSFPAPFFIAWDPLHYPREVGYAWVKPNSNPQPKIHHVSGTMSIDLDMFGLAL